MWRATWQGSLFVAAVWLICRLAPRIPVTTRFWLWWLACAQFAVRLVVATPITLALLPAPHSAPSPDSISFAPSAAYSDAPAIGTIAEPVMTRIATSPLVWIAIVWIVGVTVLLAASVRRL